MEGGDSSVTSPWEPVGLQRLSNTLELTGKVELSVRESSVQHLSIWVRLTWRMGEGNGHACKSLKPWKTSPGCLRLALWNWRASWLKWSLGALELRCWSCVPSCSGGHPCCWSVWSWETPWMD